ncbi:MAG: hypothetical protein K8R53_03300 [Bacteroidales bacterium]|nr:hypothetical protein [Bacteroidales bacterium]
MKKNWKIVTVMVLLIGIVIGNVESSAFTPVPGGKKYSSKASKASIVFPEEFKVERDENKSPVTTKVSAEVGENVFMFSYTNHEVTLDDPYHLAEVSLQSFQETLQGEVVKMTDYFYDDYKGRDAIFDVLGTEVTIYYRVLIVGQIQYQMVVVDQQGDILKKKDKFFKSFKINK